ncbi:hypothetical protein [uncultured Jatrophihabitans sp.]|uniref:hypothetical protein n=1 Tax=uncultured Jatrophihabitans sp. TaxID=1610747 RepID=UPI0035CB4226
MLVAVIVLVVTNLAAFGALGYARLRPPPQPRPDPRLGNALDGALARSVSPTGTRRVISVEILNVVELAGTRGRLAGIAGSLVPGITARFVYDQTIKTMRRQLAAERVVADVRMHTLARVEPARRPATRAAGPADEVRPDRATVDTVEPTTDDGLRDVESPG